MILGTVFNSSACCFLCRLPGSIINKSEITTNFSPFGDSRPPILRFLYGAIGLFVHHCVMITECCICSYLHLPNRLLRLPHSPQQRRINLLILPPYTKPLWTASMSLHPNVPAQSFSVIGNHVPNPALLFTYSSRAGDLSSRHCNYWPQTEHSEERKAQSVSRNYKL